jgi:HK97 family phage portal protein
MASLRDLIFKSAEERRQAKMVPSRAYEAMIWGKGWEDYTRWDKKKLIEQGFERNAPFYSAAMLLSRTVASMPIYIDAKKSGRSVSTDTHPIISLMSRNMPMDQFIQMVTLWLITTGESYINIVKSDHDNRPLGLVPIPAQNIDPIQGDYLKPITGYKYTENREIYFSEEEIIFIKLPNLREYFHGMSPGVPLGEIIDLHNAAITWNKNVALGGGVPPIIATAPGITQEESNRLKDAWQMQGGAANAHRLKIVSENLTLQRFSDKPQEAEWSEAVQQSMRMIVMALGLSSELLNDAANKTYSNFQEARKALYMEAAIPLGKMIYSAITRSLQTYYTDNPVIHIDVDKIDAIQEDRALAIDRLTKAVAAGIITPNEAREELGYTSLEDADELTPRTLRQTTTPTTTTE